MDPFHRSEPRALINLVPEGMQDAITHAYQVLPDFFGVPERDLYKKMGSDGKRPNPTDNRLRLQFWLEYDAAQAENRKMNMSQVHAGIMSGYYFYTVYIKSAYKIVWVLCQPVSYEAYLTEALHFGLEQMRDILEQDHLDPITQKPNIKLMEMKAKITMMLDARKNGSVIQRVEQKQLNLNISTSDKAVAQAAITGTMEGMEKRLKELEKEERKILRIRESEADEKASLPEVLPPE